MNKQDLVNAVADASGLSKADAGKAVEGVFDSLAVKAQPVITHSNCAVAGVGHLAEHGVEDLFLALEAPIERAHRHAGELRGGAGGAARGRLRHPAHPCRR